MLLKRTEPADSCVPAAGRAGLPREVPFFLHDKAAFSVNAECMRYWQDTLPDPRYGQALYLFRQLERHPWRRLHLHEARLVVPFLFPL